ncbi:uncharacterized protein LOC144863113 [Branchiostoma floridae x Branchiostoma japonicum]
MWDFIVTISSCLCFCKSNKVSPLGGGNPKDETAPGQEEMDRGTTKCSVVTVQPPMSQPRPSKSSADVLAELREDGLLPLNTRGESVAFQVLLDKPASEPDAPPRRPVKLEKLEETLQERRERVKKEPAGSRTQLRQKLSDAANRRDEMLADRSRKLAEKSRRAKTKARAAANKRTSTAFVITSVSDTDAIVPRDSEKAQALEKRLNKRRERVAKRTTAEDRCTESENIFTVILGEGMKTALSRHEQDLPTMTCRRLCRHQLQNFVNTFCLKKDLTVGPSTAKIFYTARNYVAGKIPGELVFAVDKWPDYSAVMCAAGEGTLQHMQEIESYTFCWDNGDGLLKLLRDDKLVDWSKNFTIAAFSEQGVPALRQVCREMGKQMPSPDNMTQVYTFFKTDRIPGNGSLPDQSLFIGRLERHHAELVNKTWRFGGPPKVLEFIQYVLATFPSRCLYNKQGEPLAFLIVQPWGEIGMTWSKVPGAGYGFCIFRSLVNDTLEAGDLPYVYSNNKVSPLGGGDPEHETAPGQEEMDRGTTERSVVTVQPPMSQPRPSKSSADVLAELREDGLLPLNTRGESVAFQVLVKPASEPDAPPRRPVKLEKLEETLQERRERVKKEPAGSRTQLRQKLSDAANRRDEMLADRSRKLAEKSRRAKTKAREAANNRKSTAFVITSVSDTDAIVLRDSEKAQALEKRLNRRRERVAKRTTAVDLEKQQELAAERRKEKRDKEARKLKRMRMTSWDVALDF